MTSTISFGAEIPPSTRVADSYSDNLMDDLFLDVDRILDGDFIDYTSGTGRQHKQILPSTRTVQLPADFNPQSAADIYRATMNADASSGSTIDQQPTHSPTIHRLSGYSGGRPVTSGRATAAQSGNFQSAVIQSPNPINQSCFYPDESPKELALTNLSPRSPQTISEPQRRQKQSVSLPFLLMGAAIISAVSTVGLWALSQHAPNSGWLAAWSREAAAAELPDNSEADFLAYLKRSLEVISNRQAAANQTIAVIPTAKAPTLPTVVPNANTALGIGVLPNLPGASPTAAPSTSPTTNVIERVFVPVYSGNQSAQTAANTAALPSAATSNNARRPTVPVPAPVAAAAAIPPRAPAAARPTVPTVPGSAQRAAALPVPNVVATAPTNAAANLTDVTPVSEQVLVGVLNLGSRSAALFEVGGSSQRAYVGDRIGVSDWTLVSINGQDVVIRRNGEVRSVYIGQRF
ncbi:MAG: hypothetical protein WA885_01575 [Phormidesmis sp.]